MEAQEIEKIVAALRCTGLSKKCDSCDYGYHLCRDSDCNDACDNERLDKDAAAAIEALQAQLPKRGKWVEDTTTYAGPGLSNYKCSLCGKICGTWRRGLEPSELPNWCGNCGADMRKMEVQE